MDPTLTKQHDAWLARITQDPHIQQSIQDLKVKLEKGKDPFLWLALPSDSDEMPLPKNVRSAWIFLLKANTPSPAHFHPNSIQHTAVLEGEGHVIVGGVKMKLQKTEPCRPDTWLTIPENTPHEFFPNHNPVTVLSLHSATENQLLEIECQNGSQRKYI
ncbi:MAG: cupin domain-containing protein [Planctomycetota bacterium]|jgi:mannose-6-phosphate isomerase-like protein (cupin superfamily)